MNKLDILECTLRDGSYVINYQFNAKDTAVIAAALEHVGFRYIEIGHGLGLNASKTKGKAAVTDETYLKTAKEVLDKAKYGMFFIPGIGRKVDLDLAAKYDMDFVRVGTNVSQAEEAKEYIKYAKDLGMLVTSNLMKSYALSPEKFAQKTKLVEDYGADIIFLVDSAGGMLPKDVQAYIQAMKKEGVTARIGFHGHNNFSLALANTLTAIENGATIVDSSLMGIGRSAGNTATEVLVTVLKKIGYDLDIDIFKTMDIAKELIKPLMVVHEGTDAIAITSGYAEFHSSFLDSIYKASTKYSIDPRKLIISVCEKDKVNVPESLAEELARQLHEERAALSHITKIDFPTRFNISKEQWNQKLSLREKSRLTAEYVKNLSFKNGKQTIFVINISAMFDNLNIILPHIYETSSYLMVSSEMTNVKKILDIVKNVDGIVDFIIVDEEKKKASLSDILQLIKDRAKTSVVLPYKGNTVWIQAIDHVISMLHYNVFRTKIGIVGVNDTSLKLALSLSERGAHINIFDKDASQKQHIAVAMNTVKQKTSPFPIQIVDNRKTFSTNSDILIGLDTTKKIDIEMVQHMKKKGFLIDAIFGSINSNALNYAQNQNIKTFRVDIRAAIAGEMTTVLRTYNMIKDAGKNYINGIPIISPTYIGKKGDIVVDSVLNPTEVIGVADGKGRIIYPTKEYKGNVKNIELEIIKRKVEGKNIWSDEKQ